MNPALNEILIQDRDRVEQVIDQVEIAALSGRLAEVCRLAAEFGAKVQGDDALPEDVQRYHELIREGSQLGERYARVTARYLEQEEKDVE